MNFFFYGIGNQSLSSSNMQCAGLDCTEDCIQYRDRNGNAPGIYDFGTCYAWEDESIPGSFMVVDCPTEKRPTFSPSSQFPTSSPSAFSKLNTFIVRYSPICCTLSPYIGVQ